MKKNKKLYIVGFVVVVVAIGLFIKVMDTQNDKNGANDSMSNIPTATAESPTFENTIWFATSISDNKLNSNSAITITFDNNGRLEGFDGCNTFVGSYEINGSTIEIDPNLVGTRKACDTKVMEQADAFTKLLLASTNFKLGDGVLVLSQGENYGLTFTGTNNSLAKTSWDITSYNNGNEAVVGTINGTSVNITFGDDGTISGSTGCNTFSSSYSLNGKMISIEPIATTLKECIKPDGIMQQEAAILMSLEKANTWFIQGSTLYLRTADDSLAIVAVITP